MLLDVQTTWVWHGWAVHQGVVCLSLSYQNHRLGYVQRSGRPLEERVEAGACNELPAVEMGMHAVAVFGFLRRALHVITSSGGADHSHRQSGW